MPAMSAAAVSAIDDAMAEFQAGRSSESSLEETLGDLKDDEPSGPNLIDQALEAEAVETSAPAAGIDDTELLDADEAEALEEAVAAEEAEAVADTIDDTLIEEPVQMHEAMQRRARGSSNDSTPSASGGAAPSVQVQLSGDMQLRLSYEFEGQDVIVSFSDGALKVELSDGTEFKIPVRRNPLKKTG